MPRDILDEDRCRKSYTVDLRERVVYQRFVLGLKITEISLYLNMSKRTVERILQLWKEMGEVIPNGPGQSGQRQRILDHEEIAVSAVYLIPGSSCYE